MKKIVLQPVFLFLFLGLILQNCGSNEGDPEPSNSGEIESIRFVTNPRRDVDYDKSYLYSFRAESDSTDSIQYTLKNIPSWLIYDPVFNKLTGEPGWVNKERNFTLSIQATDGIDTIHQSFNIFVNFVEIDCTQGFGDPDSSLYVLPYDIGKTSVILQSYCNPTNSHNNTFALDFLLDMGDTIRASRAGKVLKVQENFADSTGESGKENFVYVKHSDGSVIRYVHLLRHGALVAENDNVEQGQAIGLNGLSGGTPIPHLHFELFREFTWSDKRYSLPVNFRNTDGPLDNIGGLISNRSYLALDFVPDNE